MGKKTKKTKKRGRLDPKQLRAQNITFASSLKSKQIKSFISLIKAVNFVEKTEIQLTQHGLKYVAAESQSFQVSAYIQKEFFDAFHIKLPQSVATISFGVKLSSLTDLLSAFLDNDLGSMKITYYDSENIIAFTCDQVDSGEQNLLKIRQGSAVVSADDDEKCEITTDYFIRTMHSIDPVDFDVGDSVKANCLILNAVDFSNIINDFDRTIEALEIKVTQTRLTLKSVGILQFGTVVKFSANSEVFEKFECSVRTKFTFKFEYFKVIMKALSLASLISMITYTNGMTTVQLMLKTDEDEEASAYVEYNMIPDLPETDEEVADAGAN